MAEINELKTLETPNGEYNSFTDQTARKELKAKLSAPDGLRPGMILKVKSLQADGAVVLEGVEWSEAGVHPDNPVVDGITIGGENGVRLDSGGEPSAPILALYGAQGGEPVRVSHVAPAQENGEAVPLGQVKELIRNQNDLVSILTSPNGTKWTISVSDDGVITATKYADSPGGEDGPALETYTIFVPDNAPDGYVNSGIGVDEFLTRFYDDFVNENPAGITVSKASIGRDESGLYDIWAYDFRPDNYTRTILLSSGLHAEEIPASFGLANFLSNIYSDSANEAFRYIRENVRIKVIPVINPWGFNQASKSHPQSNGVNINRNFDVDGKWDDYDSTSPMEQKGAHPFSEAETQTVARWALNNWAAEFWIDCHTGKGYSHADLWLYYQSDSPILDRIEAAIPKIETWFEETYGVKCVTDKTIDAPGSIRTVWSTRIAGIPSMTIEQATARTTFGTSANNEAADISNYCTNLSTFVQEFLLAKYAADTSDVVAITNAGGVDDVLLTDDVLSATVEIAVTPANTTQNKFSWESSDEAVCKVFGGTNKAVIVRVGSGDAVVTAINRYNSNVKASVNVESVFADGSWTITNNLSNVTNSNPETSIANGSRYSARLEVDEGHELITVEVILDGKDITAKAYRDGAINITGVTGDIVITAIAVSVSDTPTLNATICGTSSKSGMPIVNPARVTTDYIPVNGGDAIEVKCQNGYLLKTFFYDEFGTYAGDSTSIGDLSTDKVDGTVVAGATLMKLLLKKADGSNFTSAELEDTTIVIDKATQYALIDRAQSLAYRSGYIDNNGAITEYAGRVYTEYIALNGADSINVAALDLNAKMIPRLYSSDKTFLPPISPDWYSGDRVYDFANWASGASDVAYVRFAIDAADVSGKRFAVNGKIFTLTA